MWIGLSGAMARRRAQPVPKPHACHSLYATGYDNIDVAVVTGEHPVLDAEAMGGIPLYERVSGAFAEAQITAIGHLWDTAKFRELDRRLLTR
ncbi:hypothetical protein [Candidatus Neomicrothrix sp.]|uniref:hypothetical protein n=1 Tax=Candidatus Neomicrothrix sp. TaxID=2719034 RepID=UPI0025934933|nr:hypothetical protein [Candidatus Microthrix sp.]HMS46314.1 hypothetical protein [Candidatus Microthrix sp.]